jgi:hypothetical protein
MYKDPTKTGLFIIRKFSPNGARFAHVELTSCHNPPSWAGSWIEVWRQTTNQTTESMNCSFENCPGMATLGAHVRYTGSPSRFASWYITPACSKCNRQHGLAARLKPKIRLVKVMEGNVFKPHRILCGKIDPHEADRLVAGSYSSRGTTYAVKKHRRWEYLNLSLKNREKTKKEKETIKDETREWPIYRTLGYGWKK